MGKKFLTLAIATICAFSIFPSVQAFSEKKENRPAMEVSGAGIVLNDGTYSAYMLFNKTIASAFKDVTMDYGESATINGKSVKELNTANSEIKLVYKDINSNYVLSVEIPEAAGIINGNKTDVMTIKKGFTGDSECITAVDVKYNLGTVGGTDAKRIYRLDESQYDDTTLISVGTPSKNKGAAENMIIKLYMDKTISFRKIVDLEFWHSYMFMSLMLPEYPFTQTEVDTFFNFGLFGKDNPDSLLYNIQFGAETLNDLKVYGTQTPLNKIDTINGVDLYNVYSLMASTNGSEVGPMQLSIQIHYSGNTMEFILKGDSTEKQFNLAPDTAAETNMVIRLKKGLLFPTGVMIKEDITFFWNSKIGKWMNISNNHSDEKTYIDDTLTNQGGYTDEELGAARG